MHSGSEQDEAWSAQGFLGALGDGKESLSRRFTDNHALRNRPSLDRPGGRKPPGRLSRALGAGTFSRRPSLQGQVGSRVGLRLADAMLTRLPDHRPCRLPPWRVRGPGLQEGHCPGTRPAGSPPNLEPRARDYVPRAALPRAKHSSWLRSWRCSRPSIPPMWTRPRHDGTGQIRSTAG